MGSKGELEHVLMREEEDLSLNKLWFTGHVGILMSENSLEMKRHSNHNILTMLSMIASFLDQYRVRRRFKLLDPICRIPLNYVSWTST